MVTAKLTDTVSVENELGEGVIWDAAGAAVWWTDIEGRALYRYSPADKQLQQWSTPERLGCFALVADSDNLICGFASGFAYYNPATGAVQWLGKIESDNPGTRLNDGRADRQGRFWAGSMVEAGEPGGGALYSINNQLQVCRQISGLTISNGLCWSPDGKLMYHTDTPSRSIYRYEFDTASGVISNQSLLVGTEKGCFPDGATVDAEGYIWSAQWAASRVVRYSPAGEVDFILPLPVSQPTCVAFGGPGLNRLFITSAHQGLDNRARAAQPEAGNLFIFETDIQGVADPGFQPA